MRKIKAHTLKIISFLFILISVIIISGVISAKTLTSDSQLLNNKILEIQSNTEKNDWTKAKEGLKKVKHDWSGMESTWTILLDHMEIDNIDTSLSRLEKFVEIKDKVQTLSEAATLKQYILHIPQKEGFNLKNIF